MGEMTNRDWFLYIMVTLEDLRRRLLRLSQANGLPALSRPVLVLHSEETEIWIRMVTQVLQIVVPIQYFVYIVPACLIHSIKFLSPFADLIVGAFGVDKAVLYRYVKLLNSANTLNNSTESQYLLFYVLSSIRARPIVRASASLTVQPTMFNPEERTCEVSDGNDTNAVSWYGLSPFSFGKRSSPHILT